MSDNKNYLSKILIFLRGENYFFNEERKRKIFLKIILCLRKMDSKSRICKFSREKRNRRKILNSFTFFFFLNKFKFLEKKSSFKILELNIKKKNIYIFLTSDISKSICGEFERKKKKNVFSPAI